MISFRSRLLFCIDWSLHVFCVNIFRTPQNPEGHKIRAALEVRMILKTIIRHYKQIVFFVNPEAIGVPLVNSRHHCSHNSLAIGWLQEVEFRRIWADEI